MNSQRLFNYVLSLGDDALIIAQRLSEWAYKAPFLEEDIALSNISLDLFGRANMLLDYAAKIKGNNTIADDLAFRRNEREYHNHLLCEQPNGHFGETITRQFLFDSFYSLFLEQLAKSTDKQLSAIANKSIKEVTYHLRHSSQWVIRLGAGTEESHNKMNRSLNKLWQFTDEFRLVSGSARHYFGGDVVADSLNVVNNMSITNIGSITNLDIKCDSHKNIRLTLNNLNLVLELFTIDLLKNKENYEINLIFSNNAYITLSTEIVEATLEDQNKDL